MTCVTPLQGNKTNQTRKLSKVADPCLSSITLGSLRLLLWHSPISDYAGRSHYLISMLLQPLCSTEHPAEVSSGTWTWATPLALSLLSILGSSLVRIVGLDKHGK